MTMELAGTAVALLAPYLASLADGASAKLGEEAVSGGAKILGWLRTKLTGRGSEALGDLAADPQSPDNQADLRKQIRKLIQDDPKALGELQQLLAGTTVAGESMVQTVSGAESIGSQIRGDDNEVTIQR